MDRNNGSEAGPWSCGVGAYGGEGHPAGEGQAGLSEGCPGGFTTLMPDRWLRHPSVRMAPGACALVPVEALCAIAHPDPTPTTDLGTGPREWDVADVWSNILDEGMSDPLVVVWGVPRDSSSPHTLRLESGNHRVHTARAHGCSHLPVVSWAMEGGVFHPGNGLHRFPVPHARYQAWMAACDRGPERFEPYPHPLPLAEVWPVESLPLAAPIVPLADVLWRGEAGRGLYRFAHAALSPSWIAR